MTKPILLIALLTACSSNGATFGDGVEVIASATCEKVVECGFFAVGQFEECATDEVEASCGVLGECEAAIPISDMDLAYECANAIIALDKEDCGQIYEELTEDVCGDYWNIFQN